MGLFDKFKRTPPPPADFSEVDSNEKAYTLHKQGKLAKLYLMPLEFGGQDNQMNTLFATQAAVQQKAQFDAKIESLLEQGLNLSYSASPEYKGKSFVPSQLTIEVTGDRTLTETIDIW